MNKWLLLLTLLAALAATPTLNAQTNCCPQPPDGVDCYPEYATRPDITNLVAYSWYQGQTDMYVGQTHVTEYIALQQQAHSNITYEVQYKRSLLATQWLAYSRVTLTNDDTLTTFHPVYTCEQSRFLRICSSPADPTNNVSVDASVWCAIPGMDPTKRP